MLRLRNLESGYGRLKVLRKVSLHVNPGEVVAIIGANGAGKTTLLNTLAGIIRAWSGEVLFGGRDLRAVPPPKRVYCGISLVPEGRQVFKTMSVEENLFLGGIPLMKKEGRTAFEEEIEHIYNLFPRLKERRYQLAGTLSGGEQQMLAIGRALMSRPSLIMMDEPSMGLAPLIVRDIFAIIEKLRDEGKTVLLVEQNARAALSISHRGYVLETGRIILQGPSDDLLANRDVQRAYLGKDLDVEV